MPRWKWRVPLATPHPQGILPPGASEIARHALASSEKKLNVEISLAGKTLSWSFFPITASQVVHCYGVDITEMESLEAQFRQAQKMESIGQLAAGVAHDFNNILTVIQGYADMLHASHEGDPEMSNPLKQIANASRRASGLTRQLLMFSRKQVLQPRVLDLNAVLRNLHNMLTRLLGESVAVETQLADSLPALEADAGMLEQVVMNLAVNSRDAMPKGGRLVITTSAVDIDREYVRRRPDARAGKALCLSVRDNGTGMDPKRSSASLSPSSRRRKSGRARDLAWPQSTASSSSTKAGSK